MRRDRVDSLFAVFCLVVVGGGALWAVLLNGEAESDARVGQFLGGDGSVNRAPVFAVLALVAVLVLAGYLARRSALRRQDEVEAGHVNEVELDAALVDDIATYQLRRGGMSHATVVKAAHERGYRLTSQGADGSLVFERITQE